MCTESVANGFKVDKPPEDENELADGNKEESNDSDKSGTPAPDKQETTKHAKLKQQNSGEKRKRKKRKKKKWNNPIDSTTVANVGVNNPIDSTTVANVGVNNPIDSTTVANVGVNNPIDSTTVANVGVNNPIAIDSTTVANVGVNNPIDSTTVANVGVNNPIAIDSTTVANVGVNNPIDSTTVANVGVNNPIAIDSTTVANVGVNNPIAIDSTTVANVGVNNPIDSTTVANVGVNNPMDSTTVANVGVNNPMAIDSTTVANVGVNNPIDSTTVANVGVNNPMAIDSTTVANVGVNNPIDSTTVANVGVNNPIDSTTVANVGVNNPIDSTTGANVGVNNPIDSTTVANVGVNNPMDSTTVANVGVNNPMAIDSTAVANVGVPSPQEVVQMLGESTGNQKANDHQERKSDSGVLRTHVEKKCENSNGIKTDLNENCESDFNNYGTNCESSHVELCNDKTIEVAEKQEELNKYKEATSCVGKSEHNLFSDGTNRDSQLNDTSDENRVNDKQKSNDVQVTNGKQKSNDIKVTDDKQESDDKQATNDKQESDDKKVISLEHHTGDKLDTNDYRESNDKQLSNDKQKIYDMQVSNNKQYIDKQDTNNKQEITDNQANNGETQTSVKPDNNDNQDTNYKKVADVKNDGRHIDDSQNTEDKLVTDDKQETEDKLVTNDKQETKDRLVTDDKLERIEKLEVNAEQDIHVDDICNESFGEKHECERPKSESSVSESCQSMCTETSGIGEKRNKNSGSTIVVHSRNILYNYENKGMLTREAMLDNINRDESIPNKKCTGANINSDTSTLLMRTLHQANIMGDDTSSSVTATIVPKDLDNFKQTSTSCSRRYLGRATRMSDSQLLEQVHHQQEAMTKLQSYIQEQKVAANLLTTSLRSKLRHRDQKIKVMKEQYEQQMTTVLSRLLYLEGHLQKEHKQMSELLQDKDDIIRRQKAAITDLTQKNDRLLKALQESYSQDNGIVKPGSVHENGSIPIQDHGNKVILRAAKTKNGDKTPSKVRFSAMKERLRRHKSSLELYHGDKLETLDEGGLRYGSQENLVTQNFDRKERCRSLVDYPYGLRDVDEHHNESPDSCFGDSSEMSHNDSKSSSTSSLVNIVERSGSGNGKPIPSYGFNELSKSRSVPHALPTVSENDTGNNLKERPLSLPSVELLVKDAPAASPSSSTTSMSGSKSSLPPPSPTHSSPPSESNPFKSFKNVFKRRGSKKKKSGIAGNQESNSEALKQHFKKFNLP